jgi:hypothetical protein
MCGCGTVSLGRGEARLHCVVAERSVCLVTVIFSEFPLREYGLTPVKWW